MANSNFVVHNGLTVGPTTVDAATGNVIASNLSLTSTLTQGNSVYKMNQYVLYGTTTDDVETELFINNQANLRIPVGTNVAISFQATITSRHAASGSASGWDLKGVTQNISGTVSDVGDLYYVAVARSNGNLEVDARSDNVTKSIDIYAQGLAGETINWLAIVKTIEVIG